MPLLIFILLPFSLATQAMTNVELAAKLHAKGETEMAWAVHYSWAMAENSWSAWRSVVLNEDYPAAIRNAAYLAAYRQVTAIDQPATYHKFLELPVPSNETKALVRHQLFAHTQRTDTPAAYRTFIAAYPDSVEAIAAQQRLYSLAFTAAQNEDTVAAYDTFLSEYPEAPQRDQAIERAFELEAARIAENWQTLSADELEAKARALFNQGRKDENQGNNLQAARAYRLLETLSLFHKTEALTEFLDREERKLWRREQAKRAVAQQEQLRALSNEVQAQSTELTTAIENQTQRLEGALAQQTSQMVSAIHSQTTRLEDKLAEQTTELAELQQELHSHRRIMRRSQRLLQRQMVVESVQLAVDVADVFIPF